MRAPVNLLLVTKVRALARIIRKKCWVVFDMIGNLLFLNSIKINQPIEKNSINKILLVRLDRIGDLILTTPAFKAFRASYPDAEIHLLANFYTKELLADAPYIDNVITDRKLVLKNKYDLAVSFHPGYEQNRLVYKSGARYRVGYKGKGGSFYLTHPIKDDRDKRIRHEVLSALEAAESAGCVINEKKLYISVTEEGNKDAEYFLREKDLTGNNLIVIIHPGARQEHIRWREEGYAEVADKLISEKNARVIILSGPGEEKIAGKVSEKMNQNHILASEMSLKSVIALIRRSDLFIGNSTGTMHIAAALGVPVVAIFGNKHPLDSYQQWGPWSDNSIVVHKDPGCRKCHPGDCLNFKCMSLLTSDDVLKAASGLLKI